MSLGAFSAYTALHQDSVFGTSLPRGASSVAIRREKKRSLQFDWIRRQGRILAPRGKEEPSIHLMWWFCPSDLTSVLTWPPEVKTKRTEQMEKKRKLGPVEDIFKVEWLKRNYFLEKSSSEKRECRSRDNVECRWWRCLFVSEILHSHFVFILYFVCLQSVYSLI